MTENPNWHLDNKKALFSERFFIAVVSSVQHFPHQEMLNVLMP